jgi:autotransporter-associated beta strand protein
LPTAAWPNTQPNGDEAVFQGTAGSVNVDADVYANALRFLTHNYTIASTGGVLHLDGTNPTITVSPPNNGNTSRISAPITGDSGFTLTGNSGSGSLKFLVLANTGAVAPNSFAGTLTINANGALRLDGGLNEQIPDNVDLAVAGVLDFNTSGGASDGKQEKVHNVTVSGTSANFSVGNEADFIVNSISASAIGTSPGIALNGNNGLAPAPHAPCRLVIDGWADGGGHLTLADGSARLNATSASFAVGSRILLSGNLYSTGTSQVINNHGGTTPDDHVFDNKALDFTSAAHTIDVASGTLTFTSRTSAGPLDVTSTNPGGTVLTKTGAGVWLYEHAIQSSFSGTNRVEQGTLRIGADERLANSSQLEVAGGTFDLQGFSERVNNVVLEGGTITGSGTARLVGTAFDVRGGVINVRLDGLAELTKTSAGTVTLNGANTYSGDTTVLAGTLSITNPSLNSLANAANVRLVMGTTLNLNYSGADTINALVIDGSSQPTGTWGRLGHPTADFTSPLLSGDGLLNVTTVLVVPGDYNSSGVVDAADYTVWRNTLGSTTDLRANGDNTGASANLIDEADFEFWKSQFGTSIGSGGSYAAPTAPEPGALLPFAAGLICKLGLARGGRGRRRPLA